MRGHDADSGIADPGGQHGGGPAGRPPALAHGEQRADQGPDHVVAERVGHYRADRDPAVRVVAPHGLCLEEVGYPPPAELAARAAETRNVRAYPSASGC